MQQLRIIRSCNCMVKFEAGLIHFDNRWYIVNVNVVDVEVAAKRDEHLTEQIIDDPTTVNVFVEVTGDMYVFIHERLSERARMYPGNFDMYIDEELIKGKLTDRAQIHRQPMYPEGEGPNTIPNETPLSRAKRRLINRVEQWIQNNTGMLPIHLCQFIYANEHLINAGIVITNENREEKYLEVISSGSDDLIDALAQYLDVQDDIGKYINILEKYRKVTRAINSAVNSDELQAICGDLPYMLREGL